MKLLEFLKEKNTKAEFNVLLSRYTKPSPKTIAIQVDDVGTIHGVLPFSVIEKHLPDIHAAICGIDVKHVVNDIVQSDLSVLLNVKVRNETDIEAVVVSLDDEAVEESSYDSLRDIVNAVVVIPNTLN